MKSLNRETSTENRLPVPQVESATYLGMLATQSSVIKLEHERHQSAHLEVLGSGSPLLRLE